MKNYSLRKSKITIFENYFQIAPIIYAIVKKHKENNK